MTKRRDLDDVIAALRAELEAQNEETRAALEACAVELETEFGALLDGMQEFAASTQVPDLLAAVDGARAGLSRVVSRLRDLAQKV